MPVEPTCVSPFVSIHISSPIPEPSCSLLLYQPKDDFETSCLLPICEFFEGLTILEIVQSQGALQISQNALYYNLIIFLFLYETNSELHQAIISSPK